jgi:hypothetical protein
MTWCKDRRRLKCVTKLCPRCRKRYVINMESVIFHQHCIPNHFALWVK